MWEVDLLGVDLVGVDSVRVDLVGGHLPLPLLICQQVVTPYRLIPQYSLWGSNLQSFNTIYNIGFLQGCTCSLIPRPFLDLPAFNVACKKWDACNIKSLRGPGDEDA